MGFGDGLSEGSARDLGEPVDEPGLVGTESLKDASGVASGEFVAATQQVEDPDTEVNTTRYQHPPCVGLLFKQFQFRT